MISSAMMWEDRAMADLLDGGIDGPYNEPDPYAEIERLREAIEMAANRLECALSEDDPVCKHCIKLAHSYLDDALSPLPVGGSSQ